MNRLEKALQNVKLGHEKAFVPYIMAGDGGLDVLESRIRFLEECGATAIEIGIPFSDPVADGPVIQQAGIRALKAGTTVKKIIETIESFRSKVNIPLIFMTYMNPILAYGKEAFIADCKRIGIDGLILPDLPIEEEETIEPLAKIAGIEIIRLVTLNSSDERIKTISNKGNGFLYAVTVNGITGARQGFHVELHKHLQRVKDLSPLPVFAGFGISTPEHIKEMTQFCDGVIVGSKIVDLFEQKDEARIKELIQTAKSVSV
ncbi:tryptophan synthase subunit alpha [Niallia endozanthoxylica]|uniref:Tryptophan synthase alpha chain n=1 Tax=Niallia endozanthoxylica TaxID=2036016 RepID=A0A5J5HTA9_9BACI|nr:tryptophan synthase subunit alpha [Niallia endozanthoxylica]KAA9025769.1 tryptophan synthase subunit alpha [Niallia endozanthoxylica]